VSPVPRALLWCLCLSAALGVTAAATATAAAAAASSAVPAEWRTYDLLLQFRSLPQTYSCDDLWYRLRDVLRLLGARAYMTITPYHCGYVGGGEARSPSVELKFQLPQPLRGSATRYAELSAVKRTVRLAPGTPPSLQAGDCELVRQLQGTLLAGLPAQLITAAFDCTAAPASFALTLTTPVAVTAARGQSSGAASGG
jgi:hypothetical protein